ncbi:hypothetical protein QBC43DRAFT_335256 [Cladorrhinum sp. PSN259]|nr:hypothetical protein QBC43DRAFT_335256 [Cladorrhinum sp. PSN259]
MCHVQKAEYRCGHSGYKVLVPCRNHTTLADGRWKPCDNITLIESAALKHEEECLETTCSWVEPKISSWTCCVCGHKNYSTSWCVREPYKEMMWDWELNKMVKKRCNHLRCSSCTDGQY